MSVWELIFILHLSTDVFLDAYVYLSSCAFSISGHRHLFLLLFPNGDASLIFDAHLDRSVRFLLRHHPVFKFPIFSSPPHADVLVLTDSFWPIVFFVFLSTVSFSSSFLFSSLF